MSLIQINNLYKSYFTQAGEIQILKNLNLNIEKKDFVAVMGASGSGKSTLMNILGALDKPTSGEYILNGQNIAQLNKDELADFRNKTIGFVFQGFNLLPRMTLLDNVALPLVYSGIDKQMQAKLAKEALAKVGLANLDDRMPNQISGGQQQRVAIARALINSPSILLADEPTGNLDTKTTFEVMNLFTNLNSNDGITIILITHEPEVAEYAKKVVRLADGQIVSVEEKP